MLYLKALYRHLPGETEKQQEKLQWYGIGPGRVSNLNFRKYNSEALFGPSLYKSGCISFGPSLYKSGCISRDCVKSVIANNAISVFFFGRQQHHVTGDSHWIYH